MEGWAQANQGTPAEELADTAWNDREEGRSLTLRQLVAPDWYWYSGPAAYNQGAPLVNYLLRVYGPERFLKLYTTCQQATFESDLRASLGVGLDELDAAYWADIERIVRHRPARPALAERLEARPGHRSRRLGCLPGGLLRRRRPPRRPVRSRPADDHVPDRGGDQGRPRRSGRIRGGAHLAPLGSVRPRPEAGQASARRRRRAAILAHPDHSLRVFRELIPEMSPGRSWADAQATPLQAYQQALDRVESASGSWFFAATHGGAILLRIPSDPQG